MLIINLFGSIACITSVIGLLPQIYKSLQTRSTHDISMLMLINYLVCSIAWIIYGFYSDSIYVTISNVLGLSSSVWLIALKIKFDKEARAYA